MPATTPLNTLANAIQSLETARQTAQPLSPEAMAVLTPCLIALFGHANLPVTAPHARHANQVQTTHSLTLAQLNQEPANIRQATLKTLLSVLKIIEGAARYQPGQTLLQGQPLPVHHAALLPWIKPAYSLHDLDALNALLTQNGVFTLKSDPKTGLVETADADGSVVMHQHRWQTDNMLCSVLQQDQDPAAWRQNLITQAAFLAHPSVLEAFQKTIDNPDWFRQGGDKNGVPHLFVPETMTWNPQTGLPNPESITLGHSWFSNQRLESQALVLLAMAQSLTHNLWNAQAPDPAYTALIVPAMAHLAQYLMAVNTDRDAKPGTPRFDFTAQSISSWEEAPYPGGMTWDTAATVLAFQALKPLLFNPAYTGRKDVGVLRQALGSLDENTVAAFLSAGHQKVLERIVQPLQQGKVPVQHPNRPVDLSLAFLVSHAYPLDANPIENARLHLALIATLDQTLGRGTGRVNGLIRYPAHQVTEAGKSYMPSYTLVDSYLASNFWMPDDYRKALNPNYHDEQTNGVAQDRLIQDMLERQALMQPGSEAEWCLGPSAILQGLGRLRQAISLPALQAQRPLTPNEKSVLNTLKQQSDVWLARNLALISGGGTRSNGALCPPWRVMEAYEKVSLPRGLQTPRAGKTVSVPGAHTLAWGQAQLYDGLKQAIQAEKLEESFKPAS